MKTFLFKTLKVSGVILGLTFISLLVWANWEKPPLAETLNLKPINLAVFTLDKTANATDSTAISQKLTATQGVTACTVNPEFKTVSVTYYEDQTSESALKALVEGGSNYVASKMDFTKMEGPKCPIPAEYIDALTSVKRALCFR
jgi:copper chaperone CopZ